MRGLNNLSLGFKAMLLNGFLFFSARWNMWRYSVGYNKLRFANASCVQAEILLNGFDMSEIQRNDTVPKESVKHRAVVPVGSGCDE